MREPNYSVRWMAVNAADDLRDQLVDALGGDLKANMSHEAPVGRRDALGTSSLGESPLGQQHLRDSFVYQDGRVFSTSPHAGYVVGGTRPHVIQPRRPGGVLSWQQGGQRRFARRVNHPGTKPNRFDQRALGMTKSRWPTISRKVGDRWIRRQGLRG